VVELKLFYLAKPNGQETKADNGKDHFDEGIGAEADEAKNEELDDLACGEQMDLALGHPTNIMCWWIGLLQNYY